MIFTGLFDKEKYSKLIHCAGGCKSMRRYGDTWYYQLMNPKNHKRLRDDWGTIQHIPDLLMMAKANMSLLSTVELEDLSGDLLHLYIEAAGGFKYIGELLSMSQPPRYWVNRGVKGVTKVKLDKVRKAFEDNKQWIENLLCYLPKPHGEMLGLKQVITDDEFALMVKLYGRANTATLFDKHPTTINRWANPKDTVRMPRQAIRHILRDELISTYQEAIRDLFPNNTALPLGDMFRLTGLSYKVFCERYQLSYQTFQGKVMGRIKTNKDLFKPKTVTAVNNHIATMYKDLIHQQPETPNV